MNTRLNFLPKTPLGKWSIALAAAYILLFVLSEVILGPGPDYNTAIAVALTIAGAAIAIAAFVTGIIVIVTSKDRSVLVFLSAFVGMYSAIGTISSLFVSTK